MTEAAGPHRRFAHGEAVRVIIASAPGVRGTRAVVVGGPHMRVVQGLQGSYAVTSYTVKLPDGRLHEARDFYLIPWTPDAWTPTTWDVGAWRPKGV